MSRDPDMFIQNVRASIAKWKQAQLLNTVQEDQDTTKLNGYLKITALAYEMIKGFLDSQGTQQTDPNLRDILQAIGPLSGLTSEESMLLDDYLYRDLVEYPFTYNLRLINSFDKRNAFNTNIVPNK
jgi:hypothetical protein